jgi:hypothetical protein
MHDSSEIREHSHSKDRTRRLDLPSTLDPCLPDPSGREARLPALSLDAMSRRGSSVCTRSRCRFDAASAALLPASDCQMSPPCRATAAANACRMLPTAPSTTAGLNYPQPLRGHRLSGSHRGPGGYRTRAWTQAEHDRRAPVPDRSVARGPLDGTSAAGGGASGFR